MTVWSGVGAPGATISGGSGGLMYGYNNIAEAAPIVVAPANPQRLSISFINPGPNNMYIAPVTIQNTLGTVPTSANPSVPLTPSNANLAGCMLLYGNGGFYTFNGMCQGAFQAFAVTGAGAVNPLTVIESNV